MEIEQNELTVKDQLMIRLRKAKDIVGPEWRKKIMEADPYYDSYEGTRIIDHVAASLSSGNCRIGIDRLVRATKAMEKAAGIEHVPIF